MGHQLATRAIGALAARQHGVVGHSQLRELGMHPRAIQRRCGSGAWIPLWRGVYAIGHAPLTRSGWLMAAVLACGRDAVLSHLSAAELLHLSSTRARGFHVTVPTLGGRRLPRITVHRRPGHGPVGSADGIPVTSPAQTILDSAALAGRRGTEQMVDQANRLRLCDYDELHRVLDRRRGQRGAGVLRDVLALHEAGSTLTRSVLEEAFLALCRRQRLPQPQVNVPFEQFTLDFFWPDQRVAVETDGWDSHRPHDRFQRDMERGNRLALAGILPLRFSYRNVTRDARATGAQLRRALGRRGSAS